MATVATFVLLSIAVDRAEALDRVLADDMTEGLRGEAFPIISRMINVYFPAGTGLGSFDPLFRMHEPFDFLSLKYFNHAHNDFLEIILDAGLPGAVLLASALIWMILAGVRAWRVGSGVEQALPQLGSVMLLLIAIASLFDYPARTPIIMVMTVVAGVWLSAAPKGRSVALPTTA
jgi:O-antigen ligase